MKNVLRVKNIARAWKLRRTLKQEDSNSQLDVKQAETVQKAIADVRVVVYIVEESDTIASIAQKFNMSTVDLLFANQLYAGQPLYIGQALYVYNNDTAANDETDEKPPAQKRTLFPASDEAALGTLSPYKLLLSSLRVNRDYSLCKESQAVATRTNERTSSSLQLSLSTLLDEFKENAIYMYKGRPYAGVFSGAPKQLVFDANWDDPIIENGLIDYQIVIDTRAVMVCHLFEDTKEETTSTEEPEEPELQFGFIEDTTSGSSGSCSYLQITIVEPGVDPKILRFKIEAAKAQVLYKKIMAWIGKPVNPLTSSLSSSSILRETTPISTPSISAQTSARTSPVTVPKVSSFISYAREPSGSHIDTYFSPPLPARLLAQHQPEQSILKDPVKYLTKHGRVSGVLTVTSSMAIFEPELNDPLVLSHGVFANQINFFMADVCDCLLLTNEGGADTINSSMQIFLRDGSSQKPVSFEGESDKILQLSTRIRQQMAGRPKATDAFRSKPVSVPSSPTNLISPVSNSPPASLPSSPSSFISSLKANAITRGFGVFEKLSSRSSSGEATPVEPLEPFDDDMMGEGSPALQADLIRTLESFVPKLHGESEFLTTEWIQFIRRYVSAHDAYLDWQLLYSTEKHGISINTMYSRVRDKGAMIIVVEDSKGAIFGGYASEYLRPAQRYYGSGESFLFRLAPKLDVYPWPNTNHFFIYSTERFISMGGGESGKYGLYLDDYFAHGTSSRCDTFHNEPLASAEFFECSVMEIWGFVEQ